MNFGKLEKYKLGWITYPVDFLFDDCRIDRILSMQAVIKKGIGTQSDLAGKSKYNKRYQLIVLPTRKGQKINDQQQNSLNLISNNRIEFERNCKSVLKNLREKSKPLLPIDFEIENCVELCEIIISFELNEGIRLHFDCDWGDYASGQCSVALHFIDFNNIQECELEFEKYGL